MNAKEAGIYTQARMMATDTDLQNILGLTPADLAKHRKLIDGARAEAMVALRYERARVTAKRTKAARE